MQILLGATNNQAAFLHFMECAKYLACVGHFWVSEKEERQAEATVLGSSLQAQPCPGQNGWALPQGALRVLGGIAPNRHTASPADRGSDLSP